MNSHLKNGGDLVFYDAVWQPLDVRLRQVGELQNETIEAECKRRKINYHRVFIDDLKDSRMQNVAVLGHISKHKLIPGIARKNYLQAITDLLKGTVLETNLQVFDH